MGLTQDCVPNGLHPWYSLLMAAKDETLRVRVTASEKAELESAADSHSLTLSQFIRWRLFDSRPTQPDLEERVERLERIVEAAA